MIDQKHHSINIPVDDQPVPPSRNRPRRDDRRGGEKNEAQLENEAHDILERLKKLWAFEVWCPVGLNKTPAHAYYRFMKSGIWSEKNWTATDNLQGSEMLALMVRKLNFIVTFFVSDYHQSLDLL